MFLSGVVDTKLSGEATTHYLKPYAMVGCGLDQARTGSGGKAKPNSIIIRYRRCPINYFYAREVSWREIEAETGRRRGREHGLTNLCRGLDAMTWVVRLLSFLV